MPWSLLAVGVVGMGLGVFVWLSPRARTPVVATVVGAALIALPLALGMVGKASDADQMNANSKPVYNQALITNARSSLATLGAMGAQMQQKMLPDLSTQRLGGPTAPRRIAPRRSSVDPSVVSA